MLCADLCHTALFYDKQDWRNLYGLRNKFFWRIFIYPLPTWPLHFRKSGISRKGRGFRTKISGGGPSKKRVSMFFTRLLHHPGPLTWTMIQIERLHFRHIWSMMTRSIHDCWHVRTNKCVRTNICQKSVFVFSVKNINNLGRNLPRLQVYFVRTP